MNSHQTTIGLLLNSCSGAQDSDLWHGVTDAARDIGINVITYSRGEIGSFGKPAEAIYDLITPRKLDGLIVSCTLPIFDNTHPDKTRKERFLAAMQDLPIVSYGYANESIPGVPAP